MNGIDIERLTIKVPGLSKEEGQQLALRIAANLSTAGGLPAAGDIPALQLDVAAELGTGVPSLADRVVKELLLQLSRET